ncbi:MAG: HD domain-containing protein [Alphaproteobacteria bacterium]|nr:HD domain-containing protein [Alphaproteobacteria bacterium]
MMLPSLEKTKELFYFATAITDKQNIVNGKPEGVSGRHYKQVAHIAATIAENTGLDPNKAYILGLFHDYGEYIEQSVPNTFHGTAGYDEMMKMGFDEVAQTCLTHSFFDNDFNPEYSSYCPKEIIRAEDLIKKLSLDDYDYLIQLSDLMCKGDQITTVEERIDYITAKYNIPEPLAENKKLAAKKLKEYFDKKCACNIYILCLT